MYMLHGALNIELAHVGESVDIMKETNLKVSRIPLSYNEKAAFIKQLLGAVRAFPSVKGLHAIAIEHKNVVDVFGTPVY